MTDRPIFDLDNNPKSALRSQGLAFMLQGAIYGLIGFTAILVIVFGLIGVGALLPPESKEAPDPTPESNLIKPVAQPATAFV